MRHAAVMVRRLRLAAHRIWIAIPAVQSSRPLQTPKHVTPLLLAAEKGHAAACAALLAGGASPAAKTPAGDTPVLLAIKVCPSAGCPAAGTGRVLQTVRERA